MVNIFNRISIEQLHIYLQSNFLLRRLLSLAAKNCTNALFRIDSDYSLLNNLKILEITIFFDILDTDIQFLSLS